LRNKANKKVNSLTNIIKNVKAIRMFTKGTVNELVKMKLRIPEVIELIKLNNSARFYRSEYAAKWFSSLLRIKENEYDKRNKFDCIEYMTPEEKEIKDMKEKENSIDNKINKKLEELRISELVKESISKNTNIINKDKKAMKIKQIVKTPFYHLGRYTEIVEEKENPQIREEVEEMEGQIESQDQVIKKLYNDLKSGFRNRNNNYNKNKKVLYLPSENIKEDVEESGKKDIKVGVKEDKKKKKKKEKQVQRGTITPNEVDIDMEKKIKQKMYAIPGSTNTQFIEDLKAKLSREEFDYVFSNIDKFKYVQEIINSK
jgi:KaiC/GvpD/RAD55 family RecA-like ATPase